MTLFNSCCLKIQWRALDEINSGVCDGMTYEEIKKIMPEEFEYVQYFFIGLGIHGVGLSVSVVYKLSLRGKKWCVFLTHESQNL